MKEFVDYVNNLFYNYIGCYTLCKSYKCLIKNDENGEFGCNNFLYDNKNFSNLNFEKSILNDGINI